MVRVRVRRVALTTMAAESAVDTRVRVTLIIEARQH